MKAIAVLMTVVSLLAAACSDAAADSVAFLDSTTTLAPASDEESDATDEEALLAFATCMRDNGIEDFEDPTIDSDGRLQFGPGEGAQQESADREMMRRPGMHASSISKVSQSVPVPQTGPRSRTSCTSSPHACATTDTTCRTPTSPVLRVSAVVAVRSETASIPRT